MSLSGTFDTMELSDLLQWVHATSKTGTLSITVDTGDNYLVFKKGDLVAMGSDDPLALDITQVLLKKKLITEDQIKGLGAEISCNAPLAELLVEKKIVEPKVIDQAQTEHALEIILDLFFQTEGSFHFTTERPSQHLLSPMEIPQANYFLSPISMPQVVLEAMRRLDEWNRIREIFPSAYVTVCALEGESDNPLWIEIKKINGPISIGELCLRMGSDHFTLYQGLYELYNLGLLAIEMMPVGQPGQSHLGPSAVLIENAKILLSEQQFDEAREVLSTAINLDPDNTGARNLMQQLRFAQLEYLYQQLPPHKIPVLTAPRDKLSKYQLNPRENFLVSRVNGTWDVATLIVGTPLGELDTLRILKKFLHAGIIRLT
jgi:hypothetical protein